ncbi:hypothetical protein ACXAT3_002671 [Clostridium sporogenes]
MAKILNSDCISGTIQRVVETPLGYIINGIYYDKKTMTPKAMQTFPTIGGTTYLGMNQNCLVNNPARKIHDKTMMNTIINDRYNPNISYVFTTGDNEAKTILKIEEYNGKVNILKYGTFNFSNVYDDTKDIDYMIINSYLGQDKENLYVIISGNNNYGGYCFQDVFCKINKETFSFNFLFFNRNCWVNPLKETNEYIYYGITTHNSHIIKRYNKITQIDENIPLEKRTESSKCSTSYSNLLSSSDSNFYTYSVFYDSESKHIKIIRYHFDTTALEIKDVCTEKVYEIEDKEEFMTKIMMNGTDDIHYEPFITTTDNKSYLNIAVYEKYTSTSNNTTYYGIYTFQIDNLTKDITYKSFLNINDYFRGFIGVRNNTFLIGASNEKCYFINFEKDKFVVTNILANKPSYIGADLAENVWIVNGLNEVEMYSSYVPLHVNIEYESENYDYEGENINTYITVEAKNYSNLNISSKLKFTIEGNAVFSSNGENVLIDTTLATGKKRIPITINGFGAITINAEMVL